MDADGDVIGPTGKDEHHVGDDCNFDVGYDEFQQESLDRHWKVMATAFRPEEEARDFYNAYAKEHGFNIRRDLLRRKQNVEGTMRFRRFLCSRAGK
ncbi:putative LRR receptor-like serine/threonine-protein kinase [Hordeum vulgare]|nr:putative LRR receptor-like serine/threonine-protein kinase [Hordeum vulgare]